MRAWAVKEGAPLQTHVRQVLDQLEARSASERAELETLRAQGVEQVRAAAGRLMLDTGAQAGAVLNMMVRLTGAQRVVEVGGSVGYSTLWLAEAAQATGGVVISIELDPSKNQEQRANLAKAQLSDSADLRVGDADEILAGLKGPIDLVFIDHWPKSAFPRTFSAVWPHVRRGGLVIANNMLRPASSVADAKIYLAHVEAVADSRTTVLDVGKGLSLTIRV